LICEGAGKKRMPFKWLLSRNGSYIAKKL
jgi:hypothetical protein